MGNTTEEDIGQMAGAAWHALNTHGELSLAQLKKVVEAKGPILDWAIGWLAREGNQSGSDYHRAYAARHQYRRSFHYLGARWNRDH
jgi:hypothetical protein